MKKGILLLLLLICFSSLYAQTKEPIQQKTRLRLGLVLPALSLETQLSKDASLKLGVIGGFQIGVISPLEIIPTFFIEPRFYLTAGLRRKYDKRTDYFSGGYLTIHTSMTYIKEESLGITGLIYGTQGNIGRKGFGYYDFGFGLGYFFHNDFFNTSFPYTPLLKLDLGIRIK